MDEGLSGPEIAKIVKCPPSLIRSHLVNIGVIMRSRQERLGSKASNWKGGRNIVDGYMYIHAPDHPAASMNKMYIAEHRLIMEKKLGRYLETYEVVHHKDGDRLNNDPSNLVVKTRGKHLSDHFKASHEVLELRLENEQLKKRIAELEAQLEH